MNQQEFIFSPGIWLGEGKIAFSSSKETMRFYTKWEVEKESSGIILATQWIELQGIEGLRVNKYTFSEIELGSFKLALKNEIIDQALGIGRYKKNKVSWELNEEESLKGFEVFDRQESGDYIFHAEYGLQEQYRTITDGKIWIKEA